MNPHPPGRLQGDDLISEVLRNMEEGLLRIRQKTLVPSIFRIYLSAGDYEPLRDVVAFISGEIRTALDEKLAAWNGARRGLLPGLRRKNPTEFVRVSDQWTVEIYPDLDGNLQPGEIEVHSELGAPQKAEYGGGSKTRRIFPKQAETPATEAVSAASEQQEPEKPDTGKIDQTKGRAFAYLRYRDQHGEQVFEVTKNQVVIGRGGRSYWVDVRLETLPDVSREHCRIRRDAATDGFTIEDVSQFGTSVNGKPVGRNASAELPARATINLAGVIDLEWEAA